MTIPALPSLPPAGTMALPLDFLLPFEGEHLCDCTLVLLLPPAREAAHQEESGPLDADRQRAPQQAGEQEQQGDERRDAQQDESKGPAAKRQKAEQLERPEPQPQQPSEQRRVSLQTSSTLLSVYSEKFRCCFALPLHLYTGTASLTGRCRCCRDWIARWTGATAEKELEVHCPQRGRGGWLPAPAGLHSQHGQGGASR